MPSQPRTRSYTDLLPADFAARRLREDVLAGLAGEPKELPPTWLYDKIGSELFEEITRLPEYYPTRCEREILLAHARDAVETSGARALVELGSGSSLKTHLLLDALTAATGRDGGRASYVALDVSEDALGEAGDRLAERYPRLDLHAVRADFTTQLGDALHDGRTGGQDAGRRLVAFLGGTIGNLEPAPRRAFLAGLRAALVPGDHVLLGADLVKSPEVLVPAYDDAAGVTAAFDLNVLEVLNRELGADFDLGDFEHRAVWDERNEWIEMRLRSRRAHRVRLAELAMDVELRAGEEIRTEVSAKFRREGLTAELAAAGFAPVTWWTDGGGRFSLSLWGC